MKKRTKVYLALLITLLHLGSMVLAVQDTQARNVYTMNWNTVMEPGTRLVTSECLVGRKDPELTVLVGNMSVQEKSHTITFPMEATTPTYGTLTWTTDRDELLEVTGAVNETQLTEEMPAVVLAAGENTVTLTLTPTQESKKEVKNTEPAEITVTWTDATGTVLTGTFQIMLENTPVAEPPAEEEPVPTEEIVPDETEPEVTEPEVTELQATEPEETQPEATEPAVIAETEPEVTESEITEPEEPTQETQATEPSVQIDTHTAQAEAALSAAETTAPTEETVAVIAETEPTTVPTTEPETEPTTVPTTEPETEPTTVPTTEPETEPATAPTEVPTEPTEPEETEPEETIPEETVPEETEPEGFHISSVANFNQDSTYIPVLITLEEGIDRVKLGLTPSSDGLIQPLPKNTRFSVNDGESFYMMYEEKGYVAEFSIPGGIPALPVLLDFSQVKAELSSITLTAQGFAGQASRQSGMVTVYANGNTQVTARRTMLDETREVPREDWDTLFLSTDTELTFFLPDIWEDADLAYSIEMLTTDEFGRIEYTPANTEDGSLVVEAGEETVSLRIGSTLPPAGTYRANFQWTHEGIPFAREQVTFFINYSAYMQEQVSGQEVQNNE